MYVYIYILYSVLHQTVNSCYAHSAIPALAFHLTIVIAKM